MTASLHSVAISSSSDMRSECMIDAADSPAISRRAQRACRNARNRGRFALSGSVINACNAVVPASTFRASRFIPVPSFPPEHSAPRSPGKASPPVAAPHSGDGVFDAQISPRFNVGGTCNENVTIGALRQGPGGLCSAENHRDRSSLYRFRFPFSRRNMLWHKALGHLGRENTRGCVQC